MSYLKYDLEVTVNMKGTKSHYKPVLALDGGAHAVFQNLEVYHGSNLLEQIREYNALYQLLFDMGETSAGRANGRTVAEGIKTLAGAHFTGDQTVSNSGVNDGRIGNIVSGACLTNVSDINPAEIDYFPVSYVSKPEQLSRGYTLLPSDAQGKAVTSLNTSDTKVVTSYCHPIVSGILGAQQSKVCNVLCIVSESRI